MQDVRWYKVKYYRDRASWEKLHLADALGPSGCVDTIVAERGAYSVL